jgi:hypothetical protein
MASHHGKLEDGLLQAMKAIDNQIARAMQRTPSERETLGVQKWEPYDSRVESVAAFVLQELGDAEVSLDSLLVLAQAFTKALYLVCDDLGTEGLGEVRVRYCLEAMHKISRDSQKVLGSMMEERLV